MKKLTLASAALLVCGFAYAQTQMPHVDQRQAQQQARIQQGVASGELTHKEAAHLEKQQAHIAKAETRAESDGKVTRQERHRPQSFCRFSATIGTFMWPRASARAPPVPDPPHLSRP